MGPVKRRSWPRSLSITLRYCLCSSSLAIVIASTALGGPIELQIDPLASHADVELCVTVLSTACDTDSTPVAGSLAVSLDHPSGPSSIALHDFTFHLVDDVTLYLSFGPQGQFNSIGTDIDVTYADAGSPLPSVPVIGGAFTFSGVPADLTGQLDYTATGTVCSGLELGGYLCDDAIDLSTITLGPVDMLGTVGVSGDDVALTLELVLAGPLDPMTPQLGTLTIDGTVSAAGVIPVPSSLLLFAAGLGGLAAFMRLRVRAILIGDRPHLYYSALSPGQDGRR